MLPLLLAALPLPPAASSLPSPAAVVPPPESASPSAPGSLLAQAPASASSPDHFPYALLQLGVAFPQGLQGTSTNVLGDVSTHSFQLGSSFNGELGVGYQFGAGRVDVTVGNSWFDARNETNTPPPPTPAQTRTAQGGLGLFTAMVNGYVDIPLRQANGQPSRWRPYLGAGIGYGSVSTPGCAFGGCFQAGSYSALAYQGKVGLGYRTSPGGTVYLEGAYLGAGGGSTNGFSASAISTWRLNLGYRLRLGGQ